MNGEMRVMLRFTEPLLGTIAANKKVFTEFIAQGNEDELETLPTPEEVEKHSTVFHRDNGHCILYDYQLKGFFKDACSMLRRVPGTRSHKLAAHKKVIDGLVFIKERRIPVIIPDGAAMAWLERPLRAQTARGERIALTRSEAIPVGASLECTIELLNPKLRATVIEWLNYGARRGLGQWRNGGYGRFEWGEVEE